MLGHPNYRYISEVYKTFRFCFANEFRQKPYNGVQCVNKCAQILAENVKVKEPVRRKFVFKITQFYGINCTLFAIINN